MSVDNRLSEVALDYQLYPRALILRLKLQGICLDWSVLRLVMQHRDPVPVVSLIFFGFEGCVSFWPLMITWPAS